MTMSYKQYLEARKTSPWPEEVLWEAYREQFDLDTKPVRIYRNLTKDCISIKAYHLGLKTYRLFRHHQKDDPALYLAGVVFKVNEAGRQRVIETKHKTVHAVVEGILYTEIWGTHFMHEVSYNPYKYGKFVKKVTEECSVAITETYYAKIQGNKIYV